MSLSLCVHVYVHIALRVDARSQRTRTAPLPVLYGFPAPHRSHRAAEFCRKQSVVVSKVSKVFTHPPCGSFRKLEGTLFWGPDNKDPTI